MTEAILKIMLVDDEKLVRDLLRRCVDWANLGMEVAGEAASAHEAIDLLELWVPDIVFTDICMPAMDGIELSRIIRAKYPHTKVVIITGYDDFEYAQRSIKAGVDDFVLKPINDQDITKLALKLKSEIERERVELSEYNQIKEQLTRHFPYLKERFLNELVLQNHPSDEVREKYQYYDIPFNEAALQVAIVEMIEENNNSDQEEWLIKRMSCNNLIRQQLENEILETVFLDHLYRTVIINHNGDFDLNLCCEKLKTVILQQLPCAVCIGIGNRYQGLENIRLSYQEANNALKYKVLFGKNEVIFYRDIDFSAGKRPAFTNEQLDTFYFYLKAGMKEAALELLKSFFKKPAPQDEFSTDQLRALGSNLIAILLNTITDLGIHINNIFGSEFHPYDQVFKIDSMPEMEHYLEEITITTVLFINQLRHKKVSKMIQDIQDYIINNFTDPELSLATLAKKFYLNPSYLSRVFRQETQQTFVEYLTELRMEKAMKLLKETDLKAYQVAAEIGINDPHYFGLCFKKYTGSSVGDYRRN